MADPGGIDLKTGLGMAGGALAVISTIAGWVTKKNDRSVEAVLAAAKMKDTIDALAKKAEALEERVADLEAALKAAEAERQKQLIALGDPKHVVHAVRKLLHWYLTTAKRVVAKMATAQSNDRMRAVRPEDTGGHKRVSLHDAADDAEDADIAGLLEPHSDGEDD